MPLSDDFLRSPTPNYLPYSPPISPDALIPAEGEEMVAVTFLSPFVARLGAGRSVRFPPGTCRVPASIAADRFIQLATAPRPLRPGDLYPAPGEAMTVVEVLHPCTITLPGAGRRHRAGFRGPAPACCTTVNLVHPTASEIGDRVPRDTLRRAIKAAGEAQAALKSAKDALARAEVRLIEERVALA